ncbi:MAG: tetratricopeptide (TPR) repeat protein [Crocinitomix sp.]|jgi:tetratricopeptide (TPR) repeat protein
MKPYLLLIFLLPTLLWSQVDYASQRDSLFSIARNQTEADTIRGEAYLRLSELYYMQNVDSMLLICEEGVKVTSLYNQKITPVIHRKLLDQKSQLINNAGLGNYKTGNLSRAATLWYKSLELEEELGDILGQTRVLNNIGNVQLDLEETEKSIETFHTILPLQEALKDSAGIARTYNVLGYIERINGNDSLALDWYEKALGIRLRINSKAGIAASRINIGFIYKKQEKYTAAIRQYHLAAEIYRELGDRRSLITVSNNLANCAYEIGDYLAASKFARSGYIEAVELQALDDQMYLNEILYKINKSTGNDTKALLHYQEFITIKDSINSRANYKALVNLEMEYEFQKKEKIKELERIQEKARADLKNQAEQERSFRFKLIAVLVSIGLLLVMVLLYFISKQLHLSKQQQSIIEKQNKEIEMKALRSQMNPHFLFNSLNSIKHFIIKNESTVAAGYLTKFAKLVRLVLENSKHNLISLQEELDCLNYYLELEKLRFDGKFDFKITNDAEAISVQVPPLILQPFIENAIWHGILNKVDGLGQINIVVKDMENAVQIEICDNGIGRKKAADIVAESGLQKKSMGLTLTHDRLKVLNRVIGIESTIEFIDLVDTENHPIGTKVIVYLPYHE